MGDINLFSNELLTEVIKDLVGSIVLTFHL